MDRKIERKKGLKTKHFVMIGVALIMVVTLWQIIGSSSGTTFRTDRSALAIADVNLSSFDDYISLSGSVAPITTIYMDAYEGGRVTEKLIEEGAMVKKGDIILKLENRELYEQILASENNLALKQNDLRSTKLTFESREVDGRKDLVNAKFELQKLERNYHQNKALYDEGLISKEDFLVSKEKYQLSKNQFEIIQLQTKQDATLRSTSLQELDSDLARMRKTLSMIYERIDHLNVRATADGQLGFLDAEIGQSINKGERIGQINVLTDYKIEATIDEHYIDRVKRNLTAILERNGKEYLLRLRKIYPEVRNGKFKVDLVFQDDRPETIRTGQSYNVKLKLGASNEAIIIPKGSFFQSTGGQWIFVVDGSGGFAVRRPIRIGKQNARYYEVLEGLNTGETVITSSYDQFKNVDKLILK